MPSPKGGGGPRPADDPARQTTGLILCGGQGTRLGGADKPLMRYRGLPLVARIAERLTPQVSRVLISANRNITRYARFGLVVGDELPGFAGPLAGISAGLSAGATPYLFVCPGDGPDLPTNMVARLFAGLDAMDAAVAHDGKRRQPLYLLIRTECSDTLLDYLNAGGRSVHGWLDLLRVAEVRFPEAAFSNLNEPEDFR